MVTKFWRLLRCRRARVPQQWRPPLAPDERVIAWAMTSAQQAIVATNLGLWLPVSASVEAIEVIPEGTTRYAPRWGWHQMHKASWSGTDLEITPSRVVDDQPEWAVVDDLPPITFSLPSPGHVPYQIRLRLTQSIRFTQHFPLSDHDGVRVVARQLPGRNGLRWTVRYDSGVDHHDLNLRATTLALVTQAQRSLGIEA